MSFTLRQWLDQIGLLEYADRFEQNNIDFGVLGSLTSGDLREIGVKAVGDRRRLIEAAKQFGAEPSAARPPSRRKSHRTASRSMTGRAERRNLAILFCDLVGSTGMSERLDAEVLRDIVARYQSLALRIVQKYAGGIGQYMGDGVLAYFGWPSAQENNSQSAVRAALELSQAVVNMGLSCRIGIATGSVVVGDVEDGYFRLKDQVVGHTPNLAARLQSEAEPNTIIVSSETRALAGEDFAYADLGFRAMKGISSPERVWRVDGIRSRGSAERFTGWDTPIFGRTTQLNALLGLWSEARRGGSRSVLVHGEPGIGKSRLVSEVLTHAGLDGDSLLLEFQCSPFHSHEPLFPVLDRLRRSQEEGGTRDRFQAFVEKASQEPGNAAQLLIGLLSGDTDTNAAGLTARGRKERTFSVIQSVLDAARSSRTLLIVVEDLHWADPSTIEFFQRVVDDHLGRNTFAVFTCRENVTTQLSGMRFDDIIDVRRLSEDDVRQFIKSIVGDAELPKPVLAAIKDRSDGVPLYVEELTKFVLSNGRSLRHGSEARGAKEERVLNGTSVPMTLHDSLLSRIDRLPVKMEICQAAAAIGREFSAQVLKNAGFAGSEVDNGLRILIEAQIVKSDPGRSGHFIFKHSLMRDAVYESMLAKDRKGAHRQIAVALENSGSRGAPPHVLAYHWALAGNDLKAFRYFSQAATLAKTTFANKEAIAYFHKALHHLSSLPEGGDPADAEQRTWLLEQLSEVLFLSHNIDEAELALRDAMDLASNEPLQRARLLRKLGVALQQDRVRSLKVLDEAEQVLGKPEGTTKKEWLGEWIEIQLSRCNANYWSGNGSEMEILLDKVSSHLADCSPDQLAEYFNQCVLKDLRCSRYSASKSTIAYARSYVKAARQTHNLATISSSKFILGFAYLHGGELRNAERALLSGMQASQRSGHRAIELRCRVYLSLAYRLLGEVEASAEAARQAAEPARLESMSEYVGLVKANLAWAHWREGRLEDARSEAERAVQEFNKSRIAYPFEWTALLVLLATDHKELRWVKQLCVRMLNSTQQELPHVVRTRMESLASSGTVDGSTGVNLLIDACRRRNLL